MDFDGIPTPQQVNKWSYKVFGHDSTNKWVCINAKLKSLGLLFNCSVCNGTGVLWPNDEYEKLYDDWQPIDPPADDGYQLRNANVNGSLTPEELTIWLYENKTQ